MVRKRKRAPSRRRAKAPEPKPRAWNKFIRILLIVATVFNILPIPVHDVYANGTPVVALTFESGQSNEPLIGENYSYTATFTNTSPVDPGFGPYVDLLFPVNGADGNHSSSTPDGTDFISATYLGTSLVATQFTFPVSSSTVGCVSHPYAKNSSGASILYCGTTGDKLVVLQLPFGSFTPGQPDIEINVNASLSNLADANTPLTLQARAGFRYGTDSLDNPTTDPSIISSLVSTSITPTILRIRKQYNGPEDEIATGPNDPKSYTLHVDIPTGMNVTSLDLSDDVPANMQYVSASGQSPGGSSIIVQPSTSAPSVPPLNRVTVEWPSVTGTTSNSDASYNVNFYIPKLNASSTDVINSSSGSPVTSVDDIRAQANWTPIDGRDAPSLVTSNASASDHTLTDTTIAAQKSSSIVTETGPSGLTPGDTVEYTVVFQVSDFFVLGNVHATDTISDGQLIDGTFTPTFSFTRDSITSSGTMSLVNVTSTHDTPGTGNTYLDLNLSSELLSRGHGDSGNILGGCVPGGGGVSDCTVHNGGLTSGIIKYRTVVQTDYTDNFPSGFPNVDQGDPINNVVTLRAAVLNTTTLVATGGNVTNASDENLNIVTGVLTQKTIYAVNGNTSFPSPVHIAPGSTVTYRLQITQPTSNLDSYSVTDYLPLPIFNATSVTSFSAVVSAAVPAVGTAKFGPNDSFFATNGITPTLTTNAVANSLTFDYGDDINPGTQVSSTSDILFTVQASNQPFADGLFLTNQAQSTQGDTQTENAVTTQIVQLVLNEPALSITKGAVSSDSAVAFLPTTVAPVTFQSPSGTCPAFSGTISSGDLDTTPIQSDVTGADKGDSVKFAVVIENNGESPDGAFDVRVKDILPTGLSVSSTGLHLCVTRGDGTSIPFTDLGGGLFGNGIELSDASSTQGSIYPYATTTGQNIAIITYDLTSNGRTEPNASATNTATLFYYAGDEGGPDFTAEDQTDSVSVTTKAPTISKVVLSTNATTTSGNDMVIGEQVQYQVTVTVPEATSTGVTLVDTLPAGMAVVSLDSLTASSSIATTAGGGFAGALSSAVITSSGRITTITLGTVSNTDTNNSATETIQLVFTAVLTNVVGNQGSNTRINQATWNWTGSNTITANAPTITIREPVLTLSKTASPAIVAGGETTTFTLTVAHASTSTQPAFEVDLADLLPANLAYVPATFVNVSGTAAVLDDSSSTHLTATWPVLGTGAGSVLQFQATAANNSAPSSTLTNTAVIHWSTLQGDQSTTSSSPYVTTGCERTGNPSQTCGTTANDQTVTTTRIVTISGASIAKVLTATSATSTSGNNVAIGEILTYQVTVGIPDGTQSSSSVMVDTLPTNGLAIVDLLSISASGTIATSHAGGFAGVLADASVTSSGQSVSFPFDDITNSDSVTTTHETIQITYRAVVLNTTGNVKGTTRHNTVGWNWNGGAVSVQSANVTVAEPVLTNSLQSSTSTGDAGDTVTYTVTIGHAGTSTSDAFDLTMENFIPANMTYVPGSFINISGVPANLNDGTSTQLSASWAYLANTSSSVLQFQATMATTSAPGQTVITTSTLKFTSLQGPVSTAQSVYNTLSCERTGNFADCGALANTYTVTSTKTVSVPASVAVKALIATSAGHTSGTSTAIGETATFDFTVTMPESTAASLVLHDFLPSGMQYVTGTAVVNTTGFGGTIPGPSVTSVGGNGDDIDVSFGQIVTNADNNTANNSFVVTITALVMNVGGNSTGAILDNSASVTVGSSSSTSNHVAVIVVEPDLQTTKSASNSNPAFGDTVLFTLNVSHTGTSNADAYEPVITDLIPSGMTYNLGSSVLPSGWSVDESGNPTIVFSASALQFASSSASITYQATAGGTTSTSIGQILTNYATTTWTSLPGTDANERTGAGGVNDYSHSTSKALTVTGPDIRIIKSDGGASVSPSSTVSYGVSYGNSGNSADSGVALHETVPTSSIFNSGASTPGWSCANNSPGGTTCDMTIGILGAGASSTVIFAVTAINPALSGVTSLSNTATITDAGTSTDPTPGDHTTIDTTPVNAAPDLYITKTDNATSTTPAAVVGYTLGYGNIGNQNADSVTITETVPGHSTFYAASSSVGWSGCVNGSASGTVCTYSVGSLIAGGPTGTVNFAVLVDYPLNTFTANLNNTSTIADDGSNGPDGNPTDNTAGDTDVIIQQGPEYSVDVTDGVTSLAPGQTVTLTYTIVNNGNVNGTGVAVTSTISNYLTVNSVSDGGIASTTASGTIIIWPTFSLVGAGASTIRTVIVTLPSSVPTSATSTIVWAWVTDDLLNGPDPVFTNNSSTDMDTIVFPPPTGGGGGPPGGGPPYVPPVYQEITYKDGKPVVPSEVVTPPPQAPTKCVLNCEDTTYDLSIINPDGSERRASSGYARIEKVTANKSVYHFEDKGADFDYNDVLIEVDRTNCLQPVFTVMTVNAKWHHQIKAEIYVKGILKDRMTLWSDSHASLGQSKVIDASTDALLCAAPSCHLNSCDGVGYQIYIVNPNGVARESGTKFVKATKVSASETRYGFEDKGDDFDYNDVVLNVNNANCADIRISADPLSAVWHHKIRMRLLKDGIIKDDIGLWDDSHLAPGQGKSVDATADEKMCLASPISVEKAGVTLYEHINYGGRSLNMSVGQSSSDLLAQKFAAIASSVKVMGDAAARLFTGKGFTGSSEFITKNDPDLRNNILGQDAARSLKVETWGTQTDETLRAVFGAAPTRQNTVCKIDHPLTIPIVKGENGSNVLMVQNLLMCLGYFPGTVVANGHYGVTTIDSVTRFQRANGIPATGDIGSQTVTAINFYVR